MGRGGASCQKATAVIALVDCNNFFASCERLFRPDLKNKPVLVLSNNDGCVVARSNEVKALDIPMGVPYFKVRDIIAKNKVHCFSSNFALYSNISQRILGVLAEHAPHLDIYSIDEAFMNIAELSIKDFASWGDSLKETIQHDIGMPVSIGVAPTKTLAKLAGGYAKKYQQTCIVDPASPKNFKKVLEETSVSDVWGVGRRLASRFMQAGVRTAWQLANTNEQWLHEQLGVTGNRLSRELNGVVAYPFEQQKVPQKSLIASRSFGHTIKNLHELESAVASFASQAAFRLRTHELVTGLFGVYTYYRTPDGINKRLSAALPLSPATNDTSQLVRAALDLLAQLYDPENGYKKAGVFAYHLTSSNVCQADLLDKLSPADRTRRQHFMQAIDEINKRFGDETIHTGAIDPAATHWHAKKERMSPAYTTDWSQLPLVHSPD